VSRAEARHRPSAHLRTRNNAPVVCRIARAKVPTAYVFDGERGEAVVDEWASSLASLSDEQVLWVDLLDPSKDEQQDAKKGFGLTATEPSSDADNQTAGRRSERRALTPTRPGVTLCLSRRPSSECAGDSATLQGHEDSRGVGVQGSAITRTPRTDPG
jgi:hypothetical protein